MTRKGHNDVRITEVQNETVKAINRSRRLARGELLDGTGAHMSEWAEFVRFSRQNADVRGATTWKDIVRQHFGEVQSSPEESEELLESLVALGTAVQSWIEDLMTRESRAVEPSVAHLRRADREG